jgi:hypothetical protein
VRSNQALPRERDTTFVRAHGDFLAVSVTA